jgi:hypothetical protein
LAKIHVVNQPLRQEIGCAIASSHSSDGTAYYLYRIYLHRKTAPCGLGVATIKLDSQKDKEFAIVGSFFGRFSHRRNKRPPNAQIKGGGN